MASDRQQTRGCCRISAATGRPSGKGRPSDLPVGLGLEEGDGQRFNRGVSGTQWVEPDDAKVDARTAARSRAFPELQAGPEKPVGRSGIRRRRRQPRGGRIDEGRLHRAVELDAHGVDCHDGADRARADRWNRQRPVPVQRC